jgi:hypothetical protein
MITEAVSQARVLCAAIGFHSTEAVERLARARLTGLTVTRLLGDILVDAISAPVDRGSLRNAADAVEEMAARDHSRPTVATDSTATPWSQPGA